MFVNENLLAFVLWFILRAITSTLLTLWDHSRVESLRNSAFYGYIVRIIIISGLIISMYDIFSKYLE